jgi:hypothetical protein
MHIYIYHVGVCREPPRVNEIRDLLLADQPHVFRVKNSESTVGLINPLKDINERNRVMI